MAEEPWFVVPLFYAALHHVMRDIKTHEAAPSEMRNPQAHRSRRADDGRILSWGLNDVVLALYDRDVSLPYGKLSQFSHTARYGAPVPWKQVRSAEKHWEQLRFRLPS